MSGASPSVVSRVDDRYGNTRRARRRGVIFVLAAAAAFILTFTAWVIWAGLDGTRASIDTRDTAHTVIDEHSVEVRFEVTTAPDTAVTCAVQALNGKFAIVGWKLVDLPASPQRTRAITETVRTTELASTGLIYGCWLP